MDDEEDFSLIGMLKQSVQTEGFQADTPEFEARMDQLRVTKCREMRGHPVCTDCEVFDFCELVKRVMRANVVYKKPETPK